MSDAAWVALAGVATTLITYLFNGWSMTRKFAQAQREAEQRRQWQLEDARQTAKVLAKKTEQVAEDLSLALSSHADEVREKLDYNTELTGKAHEAANNFEVKLEQLARVFSDANTTRDVHRTLLDMKKVTEETNDVVRQELQPEVPSKIKELIQRDVPSE